jgi:DNA-binding transcriptional LysR family regulator
MEIRHLRYFVAVAEESSFTRAAERLWVAQPGLSAQIRQLEAEVGVTLFDRHSRGATLTQAGALLLERAQVVLDAMETVEDLGRDLEEGRRGALRIGICTSARWSGTPALLEGFGREHPGVEVTVVECLGGLLVRDVRDRRLDAALVPAPFASPELRSIVLAGDPLTVGVPPGHRLEESGPLGAEELGGEARAIIGHRDGLPFDRLVDAALQDWEISTETRRRSPWTTTGTGEGLLVTTAATITDPAFTVRKLQPERVVPFAIVHRERDASAVLDSFLDSARTIHPRRGRVYGPGT